MKKSGNIIRCLQLRRHTHTRHTKIKKMRCGANKSWCTYNHSGKAVRLLTVHHKNSRLKKNNSRPPLPQKRAISWASNGADVGCRCFVYIYFFFLLFLSLIATFYIVDVLSASQRVDYFSSCFLFFLFFSLSYFPTRSSLSLNGT